MMALIVLLIEQRTVPAAAHVQVAVLVTAIDHQFPVADLNLVIGDLQLERFSGYEGETVRGPGFVDTTLSLGQSGRQKQPHNKSEDHSGLELAHYATWGFNHGRGSDAHGNPFIMQYQATPMLLVCVQFTGSFAPTQAKALSFIDCFAHIGAKHGSLANIPGRERCFHK